MKNFILFPLFILLIVGMMQQSYSDTLSIPIREFAVISGIIKGRTVTRVLIRFDLSALHGKKVDYGAIKVPNFLEQGGLAIEAWRLTTDWDKNTVKWGSFQKPGGDYDGAYKAHFMLSSDDENPVILDITKFLKHWIKKGENYGLLLKRPYYENDGFGIEIERLRQVIEGTRLKIYYTMPKK